MFRAPQSFPDPTPCSFLNKLVQATFSSYRRSLGRLVPDQKICSWIRRGGATEWPSSSLTPATKQRLLRLVTSTPGFAARDITPCQPCLVSLSASISKDASLPCSRYFVHTGRLGGLTGYSFLLDASLSSRNHGDSGGMGPSSLHFELDHLEKLCRRIKQAPFSQKSEHRDMPFTSSSICQPSPPLAPHSRGCWASSHHLTRSSLATTDQSPSR